MKVQIQHWNSYKHRWVSISIAIDASDTILELKERLKGRLGVGVERQVLQFAGEHLRDDRTLESYKIEQSGQIVLQDFAEHCPASWASHHMRALSYGVPKGTQVDASRHCDMGAGNPALPPTLSTDFGKSPPPSPTNENHEASEPESEKAPGLERAELEVTVPTLCHHFPDVGVKDLNEIYGSPWDD